MVNNKIKSASGNPDVELRISLGSKTNIAEPISAIFQLNNLLQIR